MEGCLGWRVEQASQAGPVLHLVLRCGPLYRLKLQLARQTASWKLAMQTLLVPAGEARTWEHSQTMTTAGVLVSRTCAA